MLYFEMQGRKVRPGKGIMTATEMKAQQLRAQAAASGLGSFEAWVQSQDFDSPVFDQPETLAAARELEAQAVAVKAQPAESLTELVAFLEAQTWSEFALSLAQQFHRSGSLSAKQVDAAQRMKAKVEARAAERQPQAADTGLDLTSIPSGHYGVPGGATRLKVRIDNVERGKWAGWVFVKDGAEYGQERRYGKQAPGATYRGDIEAELRIIAANPQAAAAEYGRLTGRCGICNRQLEDEDSVARGSGPGCAGKVGW